MRDYFLATFPRHTKIFGASTIAINVTVALAGDILARFGNLSPDPDVVFPKLSLVASYSVLCKMGHGVISLLW